VKHISVLAKLHLSSPYRVVRDFLNVRVNQNAQVTDAGVEKNGVLCNSRYHSSGSCDNK
jgi:hypothetical protein